jgi:hypothetical protein
VKEVGCNDREQILIEQEPEAMAALERHAASCGECARELRAFAEISAAARTMRREWESPALWPKIRRSLAAEAEGSRTRWSFGWLRPGFALRWQTAVAVLALVAVGGTGSWLAWRAMHSGGVVVVQPDQRRLLTEQAAKKVDDAEQAYIQSIDEMAKLAAPKIEKATTPLMANYREKLLLLDLAIADCRAQIERNRWNAHLRQELGSIYQEKQRTLQEVLREE